MIYDYQQSLSYCLYIYLSFLFLTTHCLEGQASRVSMKASTLFIVMFSLMAVFSNALGESKGQKENAPAFTLQGVKVKEYALLHNNLHLSVQERTGKENKLDINTVTGKIEKNDLNPAVGHVLEADTNEDGSNNAAGDTASHTYGSSINSHHQISIDEYRRMSRNLPGHP